MGASVVRSFSIVSFDRLYGSDTFVQLALVQPILAGSQITRRKGGVSRGSGSQSLFLPPKVAKRFPERVAPGCSNLQLSATGSACRSGSCDALEWPKEARHERRGRKQAEGGLGRPSRRTAELAVAGLIKPAHLRHGLQWPFPPGRDLSSRILAVSAQ